MTRTKCTYLALIAFLLSPVAAQADIIYSMDRSVGAGTVVGSITTDGTLGSIDSSNIVSWFLTITDPNINGGASTSGSGDSTDFFSLGGGLTATATQLLFDFSSNALAFAYTSTGDFWCLAGLNSGCFDQSAEVIGYDDGSFNSASRTFYDGTVAFASVPEPGALALLGIGLLGMGAARRRKKA